MTPSKKKGSAWEVKVAQALKDSGFMAERRTLRGARDTGDISGMPFDTVIECKDQGRYEFAEWADELSREMVNAGTVFGAVIAHRRGCSKVQDAYCLVPYSTLVKLLKVAAVHGEV